MSFSRLYHNSIFSMNSTLDVLLPNVEELAGDKIMKQVSNSAEELENRLSRFNPDAEVFKINQKAATEYVPVSEMLWEELTECQRYCQLTNGYFDIGLGALKTVEQSRTMNVKSGLSEIGMKSIEFKEADRSVRFWNEFTSLDFGGIGKGILLREIDKILNQAGIINCFISFGGSSLVTKGTHPHGGSWPVGLRGAEDSGIVFNLNDHAASFSGTFQEKAGNSIPHIIHPQSQKLISDNRISFVRSSNPVHCEVLSTVLLVSPKEELDGILSEFNSIVAYIFSKSNNQLLSQDYKYGE